MVGAKEPLQDAEFRELLDAANRHGDRLGGEVGLRDRLFIHALGYLGMRASALAHMTRGWVDFQNRRVMIPAAQVCRAGRGGGACSECVKRLELLRADPGAVDTYADPRDRLWGQPASLRARVRRYERYAGRPGLSRTQLDDYLGDADVDGVWFPKTGAGHRPIPVKDDDTWELLQSYFGLCDAVMVTRQTVANVVREVAREADLARKVEPHELRHTYGTRLAAMDFRPHEIKDAMGHATIRQAEDYVKIAGKRLDDAFSRKWESV